MKWGFTVIAIVMALIFFSTSASAFGLFSFYKDTSGWGFSALAGASYVTSVIPGPSYPAGGYYNIYPGYSYNYPYSYSYTPIYRPVYSGPIHYYNPYVPAPYYSHTYYPSYFYP